MLAKVAEYALCLLIACAIVVAVMVVVAAVLSGHGPCPTVSVERCDETKVQIICTRDEAYLKNIEQRCGRRR